MRGIEVDVLGAVVLAGPECDRETHLPQGIVVPSVTSEKGLVGIRRSYGTCIFSNVSTEMTLTPAPPSMSVLVTATLLMVRVHTRGMVPTALVVLGWSLESKEIANCDHLSL